jgi:transcriptional regulator with XRE-family HTH domain
VKPGEAAAKMFGRTLCLTRQRCGYSQEALAERAGMSRDGINKIEAGTRSPRLGTLLALADALNVDPSELLEGLR